MDLRRLEYFLRIAELGSLNRATDYLRISQPSLSRQMRLLEEELGVPLFRRHRRGMQLTSEGEELQDRLAGPIRQVGMALQDVKSMSPKVAGEVTVGMLASTAQLCAGRLAQIVHESEPNIKLRIVEGYAGNFVKSIKSGELDIALLRGPSPHWDFSTNQILTEELVLVGPSDSELDPNQPIQFQDLFKFPLVLPNPSHYPGILQYLVERFTEYYKKKLNITINADADFLVKAYIKSGLGYGLLTTNDIRNEFMKGDLKYAPIENPSMPIELLMATYPASRFPRATKRIKSIIEAELYELVRNETWIGARLGGSPTSRGQAVPLT